MRLEGSLATRYGMHGTVTKKIYLHHIPKTGGSAAEKILRETFGERFESLGHCVCSDNNVTPWVKRAYEARCPEVSREDSVTLMLVRNPFDLLVSMYLFGIPYTVPAHYGVFGYINMPFNSFREFIDAFCNAAFPWFCPPQQKSLYFSAFDDQGRAVPQFAVRQEQLSYGLRGAVARTMGVEVKPVERVNVTAARKTAPYTDFYDEDMVRKVTEALEGDLRAFGYTFGGQSDEHAWFDISDVRFDTKALCYTGDLPPLAEPVATPSGLYADRNYHQENFLEFTCQNSSWRAILGVLARRGWRRVTGRKR